MPSEKKTALASTRASKMSWTSTRWWRREREKPFTFLESIYKLNHDYGLCKFIKLLVPSNPIRQGTLKNIAMTKEFFLKEYGKHISTFNYNEKTILNYINASDQNISVFVSTYQSFNKAKTPSTNEASKKVSSEEPKVTWKRWQNFTLSSSSTSHTVLRGSRRRSIWQKLPLFTLRFGATFKDDVYKNLVYTLDSVDAFSRGLVKAITVDTVGNEHVSNYTIALKSQREHAKRVRSTHRVQRHRRKNKEHHATTRR